MLLVGLLAGCNEMASGDQVIGDRSDVQTTPGVYVGYRVISPCQNTVPALGVVGTGTTALVNLQDIAAAGATLLSRFSDLPSVWGGGGYGTVCGPGVGSELDLDNWHDVDTVIVRTGQWLRDQNLTLEVGIAVSSVPVPD